MTPDGARSSWWSRTRPSWWVFVAVAVGIGCEVVVLRWLGLVGRA